MLKYRGMQRNIAREVIRLMRKLCVALVAALLLCLAGVDASATRLTKAEELMLLYPVPEAPLISDPAADPLLRLVNKWILLSSSYKPRVVRLMVKTKLYAQTDLVPEAAHALEEMFLSAKAEGLTLIAVSGYRSFIMQKYIYARSVERNGHARASMMSAPPGGSEHQLGLAIDLSSASLDGELSSAFARKDEGKWVADHAAEYGFVLRYREEWMGVTGYQAEPWHLRYVSREHAAFLKKLDIPLETYLEYLSLAWQRAQVTMP
jgi:LAS superfamily LD-carboxypeptidase LdcB